MVWSAILGGLVCLIIAGLHIYYHKGSTFDITIWGLGGLVVGAGIGVLAQISTDKGNYVVRLIKAVIQGTSRGFLVGVVLQACIFLGQLTRVKDEYVSPYTSLTDAIYQIRGFAFCGAVIGLIYMIVTLTNDKTITESQKVEKIIRLTLIGVTCFFICLSLQILLFIVQYM